MPDFIVFYFLPANLSYSMLLARFLKLYLRPFKKTRYERE